MLSNTCFEESVSIIQSMTIWYKEPMEKSVATKIVDVPFGLQEVHLTLGLNLTDSHEINQRGSSGVRAKLLVASSHLKFWRIQVRGATKMNPVMGG